MSKMKTGAGRILIAVGMICAVVSFLAPWAGSRILDRLWAIVRDLLMTQGGAVAWLADWLGRTLLPGRAIWMSGLALGLWGIPALLVLALALLIAGFFPRVRGPAAVGQVILGGIGLAYVLHGLTVARSIGGSILGPIIVWILNWEPGWGFWLGVTAFVLVIAGGLLELLVTFGGRLAAPRAPEAVESISPADAALAAAVAPAVEVVDPAAGESSSVQTA
jgi:hypothetical protein